MAIQNKSYRLVHNEPIEELQGHAYQYEHLDSGFNVVFLQTEDTHRAFSISFATPPTDDTGLCHILEHSVCCSSKNYPLKDTFMSLDQGSVNTTLNACTYKDMTMFYAASLHPKDLENILDVYMDLIFYPRVLDEVAFFEQEAWHYECISLKEPLSYNGIVYNEMQGEYSEVTTWYDYEMHRLLFPDTCYRYDSGGVPEHIITSTHESLVAYYQTYYTASNACISLYGDYNIEAMLTRLATHYLDKLPRSPKNITLFEQAPIACPDSITKTYPVESKAEDKALLGLSFVVGKSTDTELRLAFQMLEHMLLKSAASPLYGKLIETLQLGKVLADSGYDPGKYQPTFTIAVYDGEASMQATFETATFELLQHFVDTGIPKDLVEAAFQTVAFGLFEGDNSGEPKGVLYNEDVAFNWMYGAPPFEQLCYRKHLEAIAKKRHEGYFEKLIATYFLSNTHRVSLAMVPSKAHWCRQEQWLQDTLRHRKTQLSKKQLKALLKDSDPIKAQATPECLPKLTKNLLSKTPQRVIYEEVTPGDSFIYQILPTKGIVYMHLLFDTRVVPPHKRCYVGLLAHVLTYLSTTQSPYDLLENKINTLTGGLNCSVNAYTTPTGYSPYFKVSAKCFIAQLEPVATLLEEILTQTLFTDKEKMLDLLQVIQHDYEKSFNNAPEYRAIKRCYSYFTEVGVYEDSVAGLTFYHFIKELIQNYETRFEEIAETLRTIYQMLMQQDHMLISVTSEKAHQAICRGVLNKLRAQLPSSMLALHDDALTPSTLSEAFTTSTQVQTLAQGTWLSHKGHGFVGSMYVASHCINSTYFWEEIRLNGGAYGADMTINREGHVIYLSYCDPHLDTTLDIFQSIGTYLEQLEITQEEVDTLIIGVIGSLDQPTTNEQKSEQVIVKYLSGLTDEQLMKERQEVFDTTPKKLQEIGRQLQGLERFVCCIGNTEKIEESAYVFQNIVPMM